MVVYLAHQKAVMLADLSVRWMADMSAAGLVGLWAGEKVGE